MRSETKTMSSALYELARTVESGDGVANAAIAEAAHRLDEQTVEIARLRARDKRWIEFALAVGKRVGCLASAHPDANDNVLRKLMPLSDAGVADILPVDAIRFVKAVGGVSEQHWPCRDRSQFDAFVAHVVESWDFAKPLLIKWSADVRGIS